MTAPETRLRDALHEAGSTPVEAIDFGALARRHRTRVRSRWAAAAAVTTGVVATLAIWAGSTGSGSTGVSTVVPAAPSTVQASSLPVPADPPSEPDVIPPILGIVDTPGQFHAWWFQSINVWVKRVAAGQYLYVYGGGQPVDETLEQSTATTAGVLVVTPKDQGPGQPIMSNGTRYPAPGSPTGKLKITSANGPVLTLQLIGAGTTYTFDTDTNTYG
jgi:hypothetical protein